MMTQSAFQQQRERLYRAGAGRYVAVQDFDPQGQGDIPLRRGMPVEGKKNKTIELCRSVVQEIGQQEAGDVTV